MYTEEMESVSLGVSPEPPELTWKGGPLSTPVQKFRVCWKCYLRPENIANNFSKAEGVY